jgi:hypothetical protein
VDSTLIDYAPEEGQIVCYEGEEPDAGNGRRRDGVQEADKGSRHDEANVGQAYERGSGDARPVALVLDSSTRTTVDRT